MLGKKRNLQGSTRERPKQFLQQEWKGNERSTAKGPVAPQGSNGSMEVGDNMRQQAQTNGRQAANHPNRTNWDAAGSDAAEMWERNGKQYEREKDGGT